MNYFKPLRFALCLIAAFSGMFLLRLCVVYNIDALIAFMLGAVWMFAVMALPFFWIKVKRRNKSKVGSIKTYTPEMGQG
jgi:hypothetical protein